MAVEQPTPNARAHPYRGLSVQHVDRTPHPDFVLDYLLGREVYRRTDYVALVHGSEASLAAVTRAEADPGDLFAPVAEAAVWSGPDATLLVEDPAADVGNATSLAEAALARARPGVSGFLVKGKFEHVNFIWEPSPLRIYVTEVTPPDPPKLLEQARQAVAFDEDLPPLELTLDAVTFTELAGSAPGSSSPPSYLVPCRGAGLELPGELSYLDTRPADRGDWVMIGCERSRQLHRHFYGDDPPQIDICPKSRVDALPGREGLWLVKCCLLERGAEFEPGRAVVPWGANLDEVRRALRRLAGVETPLPVG